MLFCSVDGCFEEMADFCSHCHAPVCEAHITECCRSGMTLCEECKDSHAAHEEEGEGERKEERR